MLRQLKLQDRLVALAAVPILVTAVVAVGLLVFVGGDDTIAYGIFAVIGAVVSIGVAVLIGRTILGEVNGLRDATAELAEGHRRLVEGAITVDQLPTLPLEPAGPLADVAASINAITAVTVEAGESQRGAVKAGLATIVVNLARRSQTLLDRQVEYLDRLESTEEDPDRLAELFKVDHLATRMRRNAESLKVLAEDDPGRRRGGPVDISDVLRVAMGEVETYEHIELRSIDQGEVDAGTAMDLAHLVAELMENATQFSPPETPVEVAGRFADEQFIVSIKDRGMGMPAEKLEQANATLADPPELGLGMGRSLGFMVVGRLAQRLGATVELSIVDEGGTLAVVSVPTALFVSKTERTTTPATEAPAERTETTADEAPAEPEATSGRSAGSGSGSPALERLLGLSPDALATEDDAGAPDWMADSPAAKGGALPSRSGSAADATAEAASTDAEPAEPSGRSTKGPKRTTAQSAGKARKARSKQRSKGKASKKAPASRSTKQTSDAVDPSESKLAGGPLDDGPLSAPITAPLGSDADQRTDAGDGEANDNGDLLSGANLADSEETWTPPEVTPDAPPRVLDPVDKLDDAIPSGDAFESGVNALLTEPAPESSDEDGGLTKRKRGTSNRPTPSARAVTATSRNPEEVRSMLSRYRDGLKDGKKQRPEAEDQASEDNGSSTKSKDR
ncbi:MAG: ATP-binding protein [Actinomycetota bacterium]